MSEARIELASTLSKIHALLQSIPTAEQKRASVSEYYRDMKVGYDQYGNQRVPNNLLEAADKANKIIQEELRAAVEREFAEKCLAIANEIDALRVLLPALAAKACVEIGGIARAIVAQAEGGAA